jgi:AAA15 family ATPase/GTPase
MIERLELYGIWDKPQEFVFSKLNFLTGHNNCGKSDVLRAIAHSCDSRSLL